MTDDGPRAPGRQHRRPPGGRAEAHPAAPVRLFYKADPEYGERVAKGLELDASEVKKLAAMSQEDRVKATS